MPRVEFVACKAERLLFAAKLPELRFAIGLHSWEIRLPVVLSSYP